MSLRSLFEWMDALPSSIALRESLYAFPVLLTIHVVSLVMFAGLVVMMDLRLVGLAYRSTRFSQIQARLFPWQMVGMVFTTLTGLLLFYMQPMRYFGKVYYWLKLALIMLAGLNAIVFHLTTYRSVDQWDTTGPPFKAKVAGVLSIAMWACIVAFGRFAAYDWLTFE
ncbi:MAG: hypothetical protein OEO79_04485 [Gemmatimonadota bacterium]|nr:hypothetical protein [Gemmatimonadota bacterium]MDH3423845.1 hypothetical protein [Gemmatimonadota bacterium]